ncbi:MAG: hypothetical protein V7603_6325 [Micromonosporaceae bacterium]
MKIRIRSVLAGAAALVVAGGILVGGGTAAYAAVTPGWEPDAAALGSIAFYDANGNPVTSGSLATPPVALYSVASGAGRTGDNRAQLKAFTPQVGVNPALWSGDILTGSTVYPVTTAPAVIANTTNPVATGTSVDFAFNDYIGEFPNTSTAAGYQDLYELRLYTAGPGQGQGANYYRTDVQVNTAAGTWTVVYPASATPTATALAGNPPAGTVPAGTSVALTATVTAGGATPIPGGVHVLDGTTDLGAATYDPATGVATTTVTVTAGTHNYTAQFTPTDPAAFGPSTSPVLAYTGTTKTVSQTVLAATPSSPASLTGTATTAPATLTATVTPANTAGGVEFFDGSTSLGSGTYNAGTGAATLAVNLTAGTHPLIATFTPADTATFAGSSSAVQNYVVNGTNATGVQVQAQDSTAPYAGSLSFTVGTATVSLTQVDPNSAGGHPADARDSTGHRHAWVFNGNLAGVGVTDSRPTQPGWTVSGQSSNFTVPTGSAAVTANFLGWTPGTPTGDAEGTVAAGPATKPSLSQTTSAGLSTSTNLAKAATGSGLGTENLSASLSLWIPDTSPTGTYQSTVTLTLVSP